MENKVYFRKSDWIVEFPKFNIDFLKYVFLRGAAFILDFFLLFFMQALFMMVFKWNWLLSGTISYIAFLFLILLMLIFFKGKTLGMVAVKMQTTNKVGFKANIGQYMIRASFSAVFAFSYIGYGFMIINALSILLFRGLGLPDAVSKTQVLTEHFTHYLKGVYFDVDEYKEKY